MPSHAHTCPPPSPPSLQVITVKGCTGAIDTFIVEPFVKHSVEYYLCITSSRLGYDISFNEAGGVDIEENWDKLKTVTFDTMTEVSPDIVAPLLTGIPLESKPQLEKFIMVILIIGISYTVYMMYINICNDNEIYI